jgi:hypothetical protein
MDVFGMYKMQLKQIKVQIKLIESITNLSIIIPLVFIFKIIFTKLHLMVFVVIQKALQYINHLLNENNTTNNEGM